MKAFIWAGCLSYLLIGLAHVIMGSLLPELLVHYGLDYSAGGHLISLQFLGFLVGVLSGPWWSKRLGKKGALLLCLACLGTTELTFFTLPAWPVVLVTAPAAGFGFGMIETLIGAMVLQSVETGKKTAVMSRLEVFFGVGALAMPLLSSLCISWGLWRGAFLILSLFAWGMLALWLLLPNGVLKGLTDRPSEAAGVGATSVLKGSLLRWMLFISIFLVYVGTEMSVANFLPSMMLENWQVKPEVGALSVTCFWGAMSVGRLFAAALSEKAGYVRYLLGSAGFGTLMLAGLALSPNAGVGFVLIALLGLVFSGMFAISLVYVTSFFRGAEERTASIMIASGGIGGAALPLLTGWCMDWFSAREALWVLVGLAGFMYLLIAAAARLRDRPQPRTTAA
ncbi:MFS transporter [Paenibacillus filicis]|uniref:MFS transporter n=1 Tax=Paenibacillus gyeongsangnamensis TaxID=3388067 RepID=A0ABT4Q522_9BACL|nr:MFS transporter [Paenibacillus filicis]MCZ8511974.1 MFS transporter [Paenibacillus filicis]